MKSMSPKLIARVAADLRQKYSAEEIAAGIRELVARRGLTGQLPLIQAALKKQASAETVILELAKPVSADKQAHLEGVLRAHWPNRQTILVTHNADLGAGFRIHLGETTIDYSLTNSLKQLQKRLMEV